MVTFTPRLVCRVALAVVAVTLPLALFMLVSWGMRWHQHLQLRPQLVLMSYMLLLLVAVCAAGVAAIAGCQVAIGRAFGAGVRTGQQLDEQPRLQPTPLRVVE